MNKNLLRQAQQIQQRLAKVQEELEQATVEGSAGGGAVKAVVNGKQRVQSVKIDPAAVDPQDVAMLEDLVLAAVNDAMEKAQELVLAIAFPVPGKAAPTPKLPVAKVAAKARKGAVAAPAPKQLKIKTAEAKFRATIAWIKPDGSVGLQFGKLSDSQRKGLETYLRTTSGVLVTAVKTSPTA